MEDFEKILIIRLSSIGDIILTTPMVRSLKAKYPSAKIDFLIKDNFKDLLKHNPHINTVIPFDKTDGFKGLRRLKALLKNNGYDLVIDIHKNLRSVYLRSGLANKQTFFYKKYYFKRTLLLWLRLNLFKNVEPVFKRYFRAVKKLGVVYDGLRTEVLFSDSETSAVKKSLQEAGYDFKKPLVTLCPGAGFATKRWTIEGYAQVANHYAESEQAYIVLLGGEKDKELCEKLGDLIKGKTLNLAGSFNLLESAALLKESTVVITNDTGMMHLAQSQSTPVVAIFGPTTEELGYFPFPENSAVLQKELSCRPCSHNGSHQCPKGHFNCMNELPAENVISAVEPFIHSKANSAKSHGQNLVSSL